MNLKSDIEIAQNTKELPIKKLHKKLTFDQRRLNFTAMIKLRLAGRVLIALRRTQNLES